MDGGISSETMGLSITSIVKTLTGDPTLVDLNQQGHRGILIQSESLLCAARANLSGFSFGARFVIACENQSSQAKHLKL